MGLTKPSSRLSKKGLQDVAITTPASFKGSSIPKKVPSHKAIGNKKAGIARAKASGRSNNVSTPPTESHPISHSMQNAYITDAMTTNQLNINENISEINGLSKIGDDRTTSLGVLSILNGNQE